MKRRVKGRYVSRVARVASSCAVAVSLLAWVGSASAQILSDADAREHESIDVRLNVVDAKGVRLELYDPTERPPQQLPAVVCFDQCAVSAVPGRYLLRVSGPGDVKTGKRFIDLEESSNVYIDPPSKFQRYFGLSLGILGPTLIVGGIMVGFFSAYHTEQRAQPWHTVGLSMAITGIVVTPLGWVMFGTNGKPSVEIVPRRN